VISTVLSIVLTVVRLIKALAGHLRERFFREQGRKEAVADALAEQERENALREVVDAETDEIHARLQDDSAFLQKYRRDDP